MGYEVKYDNKSSSIIISKFADCDWFTPSDIIYDVDLYCGILKETSVNLDVIMPVNDFEDYAYVYSKVFIEELDINTGSNVIGTSFGDSYKHLKEILFPIFNEVYNTHSNKTVHVYFEDGEGHIKYLFLEIIYENGNILIFYNNTTDPLLKSQQDIASSSKYDNNNSYSYVRDINGNFFWDSHIYDLIEREKRPDDMKKDILYELILREDKLLYEFLVDNDRTSCDDNIIHIKTDNGIFKTLKINSKYLHNNGFLSQVVVYIKDITCDIKKREKLIVSNLLKKLDAKLGVATLIRNANGDYTISNAFYDILHLPKKNVDELLKDFRTHIIDSEDRIIAQRFELNKINHVEKIIKYKSPYHNKIQQLFVYLENYADGSNMISFIGIKDVTEEIERKEELKSQRLELCNIYATLRDAEASNKFSIHFSDGEDKYHWTPGVYDILEKEPEESDEYENIVLKATDSETSTKIMDKVNSLKPNELCNQEVKITTANGNIKYIYLNVKKVCDNDGNFIQNSCYCRDITEEYKNREKIEFLMIVLRKVNSLLGTGASILMDDKTNINSGSALDLLNIRKRSTSEMEVEEFRNNIINSEEYKQQLNRMFDGEIDKMDDIWDYQSSKSDELQKIKVSCEKLNFKDKKYWVAAIQDVTNELKRESDLIQKNNENQLLLHLMNEVNKKLNTGYFAFDFENNVSYYDKDILNMLNIESESLTEVLEDYKNNIVDNTLFECQLKQLYDGEISQIYDIYEYKSPNTDYIQKIHVFYKGIVIDGKQYWFGGLKDVTNKLKNEVKLIQTNYKLNQVIKKSNNQVKYNLNTLLKLIDFEKEHDVKSNEIVDNTIVRIKSLMLLYERLDSCDPDNIPAVKTFAELREVFYDLKHDSYHDIGFNFMEFEEFTLKFEQVISMLLIVYELVINSIEHAFNDRSIEKKELFGYIKKDGDVCECFHSDTGVGYPANFNSEFDESGFNIIKTLVEQLNGEFEVYNDNGACFKLRFPIN